MNKNIKIDNVKKTEKPHYVNKKDLDIELQKYRDTGEVSEELAKLIQQIVHNYSTKGNFRDYSYLDDMKSCAVCRILDQLGKIDPSKNSFSYMTTMIFNVFIGFINAEEKYGKMKNDYRIKVWTDLSLEENLDISEPNNNEVTDDEICE